MNVLDKIIYTVLKKRKHIIETKFAHAVFQQEKTFKYLMSLYDGNNFAQTFGISKATSYKEFQKKIPVVTYEEFFPYIQKMLLGHEKVVKTPMVTTFAKSSGTTNAKSKYIPLTKNNLKHNHYQAGKDMIVWAAVSYNNVSFIHGKTIGTTGSFSTDPEYPQAHIGDVSAHLFHALPWYAKRTRVADSDVMLHNSWQEKLTALSRYAKEKDVRVLLGTPTWMIQIFDEILNQTKKTTIQEVWPKINIFFHGAVRIDPYKTVIAEKIGKSIDYMNIYNASEGFFGFQYNKNLPDEFVLLTHHDVFYECIPMIEFRNGSREAIQLADVLVGVEYVLVITTSGGLVRYIIGDTVSFIKKEPFIFKLTGRTKQWLNTFGEEVVLENIEQALAQTLEYFNVHISGYTVSSEVFARGGGRHVWAIEFIDPPQDMISFAQFLDNELKKINSDYEAKRTDNLILAPLEIRILLPRTFHKWLAKRGKLGGQHKVPLITDDLSMIQELEKISHE